MKKLPCLLLVTIMLLSPCLFFTQVHASTSVSGLIASNTTWDAAHSPYNLAGPLCVMTGATLTIQPGATVNFNGFYMLVNGTLNAAGTSNNKITMTAGGNSNTSIPNSGQHINSTRQAPTASFKTSS